MGPAGIPDAHGGSPCYAQTCRGACPAVVESYQILSGVVEMKEAWDALKAMLPLMGRDSEKIVSRANPKSIAMRFGQSVILFYVTIGFCIARGSFPFPRRGGPTATFWQVDFGPAILYTTGYTLFFLLCSGGLVAIFLLLDFAIRREFRPRIVTASVISLMTLLLAAIALWLLYNFGASFLGAQFLVDAIGVGTIALLAVISYIFARFTIWNASVTGLTPSVGALATSIAFSSLLLAYVVGIPSLIAFLR